MPRKHDTTVQDVTEWPTIRGSLGCQGDQDTIFAHQESLRLSPNPSLYSLDIDPPSGSAAARVQAILL